MLAAVNFGLRHYVCIENKGLEQLHGYCAADLRLCFAYANSRFSHDAAYVYDYIMSL